MSTVRVTTLVLSAVLMPGLAWAQSRPVTTQDPEPVGAGQILLDTGIEYSQGDFYPLSGLHGNLTRYGTFDLGFGISSMAEVQLSGGYDRLAITARDPTAPLAGLLSFPTSVTSTGDVDDGIIGTKVRLLAETAGRPSLAIRFSTRLPNAKHDSGLGQDTTDFAFSFLGGKTIGTMRVVANLGWSILSDPVHDGIQNDVVLFGAAVSRTIAPRTDVVVDVNGLWSTRHGTPPVGTEGRAMVRAGARYGTGAVRYDVGLLLGLTAFDPTWGLTGGLTWTVHAFRVP